jgi:hypothetical protein
MDESTREHWERIARFGMDPNARERHRGHPAFALAQRFADEWDQAAFDPDYDALALEHFEPLVRKVFASPRDFLAGSR